MKSALNFFLLVLTIISGIWFYRRYQNKLQLQKEEEERIEQERQRKIKDEQERLALERAKLIEELRSHFKPLLPKIINAASHFDLLKNDQSGYFSNHDLDLWLIKYNDLYLEIVNKQYKGIGFSKDEEKAISNFISYFEDCETIRNEYNVDFVKKELFNYNSFFDFVEGRKLDNQQRVAIIKNEDNNLVIAGAGSGKTTTIVGKTKYIIDRYKVKPEEILLISFTNKSARTLAERIDTPGVAAKTFHKFGMDIIAEAEKMQPSIFDEMQFNPTLKRFFDELITNPSYLKKVTDYFANYLKPIKSQFDFTNHGDYIQFLKDQNFRTYKLVEVPANGRRTYKMEVVKSIEECKIANFLLFNGIEYDYEYPYEHNTADHEYRQYKPDFLIKQNGTKVYLEHFAVARDGEVPPFFVKEYETLEDAKNRYWEKINWAREIHKEKNTALIETYSYEMNEGILFDKLSERLRSVGIQLHPKNPTEIWQIINNAAKDEVKGFVTLFGTFIALMKSNNYSIDDVRLKASTSPNSFVRNRNELFIEIITPLINKYEDLLKQRGEIDFSDMINKATSLISSKRHTHTYKYIIIDEFQDISIGRYKLLKALQEQNPSCKLFCVGDDWQSIYRFSGSDISLFKNFEKYFGCTEISKIETTYRFNDPLIKLSSDFILKNPNQARKDLKGKSSGGRTDFQITYSVNGNQDDTNALQAIMEELINSDAGIFDKSISILGRYSFDIDRLKNENGVFDINKDEGKIYYRSQNDNRQLRAEFMTVHKAKGLEADIVILLNCNSGKFGFPSEMSDDMVLNLLLSEADHFENGEERRLFYVAITRAKEKLYLVADNTYKSKFIAELEIETKSEDHTKCPSCKNADIVLRKSGTARNGNLYRFYGCSNYLYGCEYTTTEWENYN